MRRGQRLALRYAVRRRRPAISPFPARQGWVYDLSHGTGRRGRSSSSTTTFTGPWSTVTCSKSARRDRGLLVRAELEPLVVVSSVDRENIANRIVPARRLVEHQRPRRSSQPRAAGSPVTSASPAGFASRSSNSSAHSSPLFSAPIAVQAVHGGHEHRRDNDSRSRAFEPIATERSWRNLLAGRSRESMDTVLRVLAATK